MSTRGEAELPSTDKAHCTFRPEIRPKSHALKPRTADEMSLGDAQRKAKKLETRLAVKEAEGETMPFAPVINEVPGVSSRLKVASDPSSYLARVRQHMRLKEQLTACVREAQEKQELEQCTFHPTTHEAPAYITRIAKSVRLAKSAQPPPPPKQPEWR